MLQSRQPVIKDDSLAESWVLLLSLQSSCLRPAITVSVTNIIEMCELQIRFWFQRSISSRSYCTVWSTIVIIKLCIVAKPYIHPIAKLLEEINRKCHPGNTIFLTSNPHTDPAAAPLNSRYSCTVDVGAIWRINYLRVYPFLKSTLL